MPTRNPSTAIGEWSSRLLAVRAGIAWAAWCPLVAARLRLSGYQK